MPKPDNELDPPGKPRRRPSHFRKKRLDSTTKVVRVSRESARPPSDISHVVPSPEVRQKQWREVINPAPALPEPMLTRPLPPPAPLPSETTGHEPTSPGWVDDRKRRKRTEDIIGTVALALMVTAMLVAMWLRMTGG